MNFRNGSIATRCRILTVVTGLIVLAGCGGGSSSTPPPGSPTVSLSTSSLSFSSEPVGTPSSGQSVTINNTGNASLTLTSITLTGTNQGDFAIPTSTNTCTTSVAAGASCAFNVTFTPTAAGSRTGTVSIADNASNSPQTVSLTGTGTASTVSLSTSSITFSTQVLVGTPSTPQPVILTNSGGATLTIASIVPTPAAFTETDNCGTSVSAGGNCTIKITFTPTATGAVNGTLTLRDNSNGVAGTTQTVTLSGSGFSGNSVAVNVNFGPNGPGTITASSSPYYNGIYTTVTVCEPNTTTCQAVDNVLVDTGSVGLRLIANTSNQIGSVTLTPITDSTGAYQLNECIPYADLTYTWGPVAPATVQIGGETASQVPAAEGGSANQGIPIQLITANATAPLNAACGQVPNNSVPSLGANGILGVGSTTTDCGAACTSANSNSPYWLCLSSSGACASPSSGVPLADQAWNPVAAFGSPDTNGVVLQLPSIPAAGAASVAGTLVFGIGTETCPGSPAGCTPNGLGNAQVFAQDQNGYFPSVVFNGVTYTSPANASYIDSGSAALFVSDATTLNTYASSQSIAVSDCLVGATNIGFYCPTPYPPALSMSLDVTGYGNVGSGPITLSIANALSLFQDNPSFAAFNDLGFESGGTGASNDSFDFGMPWFFGQPNGVFTGIMGTNPPNGMSAPYGYWAF